MRCFQYLMGLCLLLGCAAPQTPSAPIERPSTNRSGGSSGLPNSPDISVPKAPESIKAINDKLAEGAQTTVDFVKEKTHDLLNPETPDAERPLPQPDIISEPANLLNLGSFTIPHTLRLQGRLKNADEAGPVSYNWSLYRLKISPLEEDSLLQEAEGESIQWLIKETGLYRITLSAKNSEGEVASTSIRLWGRN